MAYQEDEIQALNNSMAQQRREIEALKRQLQELANLLREYRPGLSVSADEPPPPHY